MMDRQQVIAKIQSILKLQNGTDFAGEASAAANLIDKLCKQYGITLTEATEVQVLDETFKEYKKIDTSYATLLNAVASFYDAKAYIKTTDIKSLQIIGSEAQQIQTRLYFEYLQSVMEKEADMAYNAEKILAELTGKSISRSFKFQFKKAFADKVAARLYEMKKEENRVHEDAEAVKNKLTKMRFNRNKSFKGASGEGAYVGNSAGSSVSLHRQTSGASCKQLAGV